MNPFSLEGTTALVTGANRGIGFGIAEALATAGADIIGMSASLDPNGSTIQTRVEELGRTFTGVRCDLSNREAVLETISRVTHEHPAIDILVNNAGTIERSPAAKHPLSLWDRVIEINLNSQFVIAQAVGQTMLERGRGKIIFTASLLSFQGGINVPGYTASKSAIAGLTKALANEWSSRGVNVNAIAPGYIATDNTQALRDDTERSAAILERIPAGRWGHAEDLGGAAVFLASRASDYVHGITLPIDGGWLGR